MLVSNVTASRPIPTPPAAAPAPPPSYDRFERAATGVVRVTAGTLGGLVGLVANGCAGGAHGALKGADLPSRPTDDAFQIAFAVNLLLAGGVMYGATSALGALATGEETWKNQAEGVRQRVTDTVDRYLDGMLVHFPTDAAPGTARRVAQAAAGEAVGLVGGAVVGAQAGYRMGAHLGDRAAQYTSRKLREFLA